MYTERAQLHDRARESRYTAEGASVYAVYSLRKSISYGVMYSAATIAMMVAVKMRAVWIK